MKEIIKLLKSFVYRVFCPFVGLIALYKNKYINVIYYHDVVQGKGESFMRTNIDVYKRHMEWLIKHGYETVRFDELTEESLKFKKKRVLIAFDDGWLSNYTEIYDYMKERGLKYNVFLTIGEISNNPEYLTWDQVREMNHSGLCGFGAHTYTHPDMSDLSKIDFEMEIVQANRIFVKELGYSPKDFCYPFGYYSEESNKDLIEQSSYERIYTSQNLFSYNQEGKIVMGRNGISTDDSLEIFGNKVRGFENGFYSFRRKVLG